MMHAGPSLSIALPHLRLLILLAAGLFAGFLGMRRPLDETSSVSAAGSMRSTLLRLRRVVRSALADASGALFGIGLVSAVTTIGFGGSKIDSLRPWAWHPASLATASNMRC